MVPRLAAVLLIAGSLAACSQEAAPSPTCDTVSLACTHGACAEVAGAPTCVCEAGYDGPTCAVCASGFQDNDLDGTCSPSCATVSPGCLHGGSCADASGTVRCVCPSGYQGATCGECAAGYQDHDGDGACTFDCTQVSLSCGHGTCSDATGTPLCACDEGYSGASCAECAAGFQDNDHHGTCARSCATAALLCAHGTCADTSGTAVCVCEEGYSGRTCGDCAAGYQDHDGDKICSPDCATAALTCIATAQCSDLTGTAACTCHPGYTGDGAACLWTGVVEDPGFRLGEAWAVTGGLTWSATTRADFLDSGFVGWDPPTYYYLGEEVTQTVRMPPSSAGQALAAKISLCRDNADESPARLLVQIGRSLSPVEAASTSCEVQQVCLGEGAFGDQQLLRVRAGDLGMSSESTLLLDHLDILPDPSCPLPGTVSNGDFSAGSDGWTLRAPATVVASSPINGSAALRLTRPTLCDYPRAEGLISVPTTTTLPSPALHLKARGALFKNLLVGVSMKDLPKAEVKVQGGRGTQDVSLCLPEWTKGSTVSLTFRLDEPYGDCSILDGASFDVDDIQVVSDDACRIPREQLYSPGFEGGVDAFGWALETSNETPSATVAQVVSGDAHGGRSFLSLTQSRSCSWASASQTALLPEATAEAGPAVRFWYRLPEQSQGSSVAVFYTLRDATSAVLTPSATWKQQILCAKPGLGGLPMSLLFLHNGHRVGACTVTYPAETLQIDDVEVTTDPSCPAR